MYTSHFAQCLCHLIDREKNPVRWAVCLCSERKTEIHRNDLNKDIELISRLAKVQTRPVWFQILACSLLLTILRKAIGSN